MTKQVVAIPGRGVARAPELFVRGPEWAFAMPQGDVAALGDVMRLCYPANILD